MDLAHLSARLDQLEVKLRSLTKAYIRQKSLIEDLTNENQILKQTTSCHTVLSETHKKKLEHYISVLEKGIAYLEALD